MIVFVEGKKYTIREPRPVTLKKYGISLNEWKNILADQGYKCPICKRILVSPVIDHLHIRNWKKMILEKRKKYIRGIPCNYCNRRRLARGMSLEIAKNIVIYLNDFEKKIGNNT